MQALFIGYMQNYLWKEKANGDMLDITYTLNIL